MSSTIGVDSTKLNLILFSSVLNLLTKSSIF
uniref:Uncharacterized protein n=1 Tax=virus sp. ctrcb4 TaxID=2825824 RepID=A0A8S5RPX0_9VIRU|nr:MAG TPA: hypothetical protein [virus sp. ctrcb4]DAR12583.1 MAG TPA: hypothetical protein [Crassvirales sp.]